MLAFDVEDVGTLAEQVVEAWSSAVDLACHSGSSSSAVAGLVAGPEPVLAPVVGSSAAYQLGFDSSFLVIGLTLLRLVFCIHSRIFSILVWDKLSKYIPCLATNGRSLFQT